MSRGAVIALSHGGGPLTIMGDPRHANVVRSLKTRVPKLLKLGTSEAPRAIVLVTAHWSEEHPTISNAKKHSLYYDYYGFPPETYKLKYDAPGEPEVARQVYEALQTEGLKPKMDSERGWDHGLFIPMLVINPPADVPIVQLSVLASEDPTKHIAMGRALSKLRDSNVAIIGSGFASFHNLRVLFSGATQTSAFRAKNERWSAAVTDAALAKTVKERGARFDEWRTWPASYEHHPDGGAEHFLPLVVCAGAGGDGVAEFYTDEFAGLEMYSYYWT